MSQNAYRRIVAITAIAMLVGCQAGVNSSATVKADPPKPQAKAADNVKPSLVATEQPIQPPKAPTNTPDAEQRGPQLRTAFYRADSKPASMPRVLLSKGDQAACKVKVGDAMPAIELPKLGETSKAKLADLLGKKATVVVFWKGDRRMSQQQLTDVGADVIEPFGKQGVAVVGVAVDQPAKEVETLFKKSGATFTCLNDADGKAFAQIGTGRFPRTYVLDPSGKIVWFDIEYSLATRRELHQALRAIAGEK